MHPNSTGPVYLSSAQNGQEQRVDVNGNVITSFAGLAGCIGSLWVVGQPFSKDEADTIGLGEAWTFMGQGSMQQFHC